MASSANGYKISHVFENSAKAIDVSDIYAATLITNHGYHMNAKEWIAPVPQIELVIDDHNLSGEYVNILIPLRFMCFMDGPNDLTTIDTRMSNSSIIEDVFADGRDFVVGDTVPTLFGNLAPHDHFVTFENGNLVFAFRYELSVIANNIDSNGNIIFGVPHSLGGIIYKFKTFDNGTASFVKGAICEAQF